MRCGYPYTIDKKNGKSYTVACGRCLACRINRTTEWTTRILHESRCHNDSIFITLTYRPDALPVSGSISKRDLQLFFKRLRKNLGKKIRYFACGEYGEKYGRPHYHSIIFGLSRGDRLLIEKAWDKGIVHIGTVTEQSARYCAKYVQKQLFGDDREFYKKKGIEREFSLMSRRPGIGSVFADKYSVVWRNNGYISVQGQKKPIPRYYKSYWTTVEREKYNSAMAERRYDLYYGQTGSIPETWQKLKGDDAEAREVIKAKQAQLDLYKNKL